MNSGISDNVYLGETVSLRANREESVYFVSVETQLVERMAQPSVRSISAVRIVSRKGLWKRVEARAKRVSADRL